METQHAIGLLSGAFLFYINYLIWKALVSRWVKRQSAKGATFLFAVKLAVTFGAIVALFRFQAASPIAFLIGFGIGILVFVTWSMWKTGDDGNNRAEGHAEEQSTAQRIKHGAL